MVCKLHGKSAGAGESPSREHVRPSQRSRYCAALPRRDARARYGLFGAAAGASPKDAAGHGWGIQANLAAGPGPHEQLDLQQFFSAPAGTQHAGQQLAEWAEKKLGFPL